MSYKLMPRLGSAIASTILSVFWAVSLVGVDKAQAAVLTYNFQVDYGASGLFKFNNSSVTGIGYEEIAVSDGRFYGYTLYGGKEFYDLVGAARAVFVQGVFRGLSAGGSDEVIKFYPYDISGTSGFKLKDRISWSMYVYPAGPNRWEPVLDSYYEQYTIFDSGNAIRSGTQGFGNKIPVSFTLVNTEPSPVPEPLTAGGTALALAGLSWLKHKKKMAA